MNLNYNCVLFYELLIGEVWECINKMFVRSVTSSFLIIQM